MTWIEERLAERKNRQERQNKIFAEANVVFDAVWRAVLGCVDEAKGKGVQLYVDGTTDFPAPAPFEHTLTTPCPRAGDPPTLYLKLNRERTAVSATGAGINVEFALDVCNGAVCLKHEGKEISPKDAAKVILDPFLFPDLQKRS